MGQEEQRSRGAFVALPWRYFVHGLGVLDRPLATLRLLSKLPEIRSQNKSPTIQEFAQTLPKANLSLAVLCSTIANARALGRGWIPNGLGPPARHPV